MATRSSTRISRHPMTTRSKSREPITTVNSNSPDNLIQLSISDMDLEDPTFRLEGRSEDFTRRNKADHLDYTSNPDSWMAEERDIELEELLVYNEEPPSETHESEFTEDNYAVDETRGSEQYRQEMRTIGLITPEPTPLKNPKRFTLPEGSRFKASNSKGKARESIIPETRYHSPEVSGPSGIPQGGYEEWLKQEAIKAQAQRTQDERIQEQRQFKKLQKRVIKQNNMIGYLQNIVNTLWKQNNTKKPKKHASTSPPHPGPEDSGPESSDSEGLKPDKSPDDSGPEDPDRPGPGDPDSDPEGSNPDDSSDSALESDIAPRRIRRPQRIIQAHNAIRTPPPARFNPRNSTSIREWLFKMNLWFRANEIPRNSKVNQAVFLLDGHALTWWMALEGKNEAPTAWDQFTTAITQQFETIDASRKA